MNALLITVTVLLFTALQSRLPTLWWLGGLRIELLPALVAYGALSLRRGSAITLAIATGFAQDAFSTAPFGLSALAYGIATALLTEMREALDRELPRVQMGAGALAAAASSITACAVVGFSIGAFVKILVLAFLSAVIAPFLFFAMDRTRTLVRTA